MRPIRLLAPAFALLVLAGPLAAQNAEIVAEAAPPEEVRLPAPVTPDDYGKWESLGFAELSKDGRWLVAPIGRVNEENELRVHLVERDSAIVVKYGSRATFSDDGRWLAYAIGVSEEEREKLTEQKKEVRSKMGLVDLGSGEAKTVEEVSSFSFGADGRFLAMRRYPLKDKKSKGVDLVVRDLSTGMETNFGNVAEFAWRDEGSLLAMVVDAEGKAGNGVLVYDASNGRIVPLDTREEVYRGLRWREDGDDLAVLRTVTSEEDAKRWTDTAHVVLAWQDLGAALGRGRPEARTLDPAATQGFPPEYRVVDFRELRWSADGRTVFFGIKEREKKEGADEAKDEEKKEGEEEAEGEKKPAPAKKKDDPPGVEIWHARDVDIVPTQKVRANQDRRENRLSAWQVASGRFAQLETDLVETVRLADDKPVLVGLDQTPHESDRMFGPVYNDVYLVDVGTGAQQKVLERVERVLGTSPGGRYLLWFEDEHYHVYDREKGSRTNVTEGIPASFANLEDDHTVDQKPPYCFGDQGWTEGDERVLLCDRYDVWAVAADGSGGERLTRGAEERVVHRRMRLDPDEEAIDPSAPLYFSVYGEWTKEYGYARAQRLGRAPERIVWEEANVGRLVKAEDAEVYGYVVQDFDDSPDYFVGGADLRGARQVTRTNAFQGDYLWGRSELIEYENAWGEKLQGALFYPAGWEAGKKYPMIVYIYERVSQGVRSYSVPSERSAYNAAVWTANGYFVYQPDIVYRDRDPGVSAVQALEPAVAAAVATGMIDAERVGLVGHSWGGYQTTFTVTQSDVFAAAVAGAPLTNLFSMYLSIYWNTGGTDARIFEISQGRMEVPFWEDMEAYRRNSPVFSIENMNTPLLMAFGTEDGAVEFNQGVEFYNAARRAGKDFVLLVYEGENHGLRKKPNQLDYHRRINEWFDHYLKGAPAPEWITEGVPYLEQEKAKKKPAPPIT